MEENNKIIEVEMSTLNYEYTITEDNSLTICSKLDGILRKSLSTDSGELSNFSQILKKKSIPKGISHYLQLIFSLEPNIAREIVSCLTVKSCLFVNRNQVLDQIMIRNSNGLFLQKSWFILFPS